jgi:BirA family biotin operon repressor/biotin-[acetyl-CoA-carboxylase] ligase
MFKEIHFSEIASTHLYAREHLDELKESFTLITASKQTAGIGRKGDTWISMGDNLLATFVFPAPKLDIQNLGQLLAYSSIKILERFALEPLFKWPNDILLNYRKVAGILTDIQDDMCILSIGLNVNMEKGALDLIPNLATSLSNELRHPVSLAKLKQDLNKQFYNDLTIFNESGFKTFYPIFRTKLAFIGKMAKCVSGIGKIDSLSVDGRLILKTDTKNLMISESSIEIL